MSEKIIVNDNPAQCALFMKRKNNRGSCHPEQWLKGAEKWLKCVRSFHDFHITYNLTSFLSLIIMRQLLLMTSLAQCALCMKRKNGSGSCRPEKYPKFSYISNNLTSF